MREAWIGPGPTYISSNDSNATLHLETAISDMSIRAGPSISASLDTPNIGASFSATVNLFSDNPANLGITSNVCGYWGLQAALGASVGVGFAASVSRPGEVISVETGSTAISATLPGGAASLEFDEKSNFSSGTALIGFVAGASAGVTEPSCVNVDISPRTFAPILSNFFDDFYDEFIENVINQSWQSSELDNQGPDDQDNDDFSGDDDSTE
jgi:hypothetical protein